MTTPSNMHPAALTGALAHLRREADRLASVHPGLAYLLAVGGLRPRGGDTFFLDGVAYRTVERWGAWRFQNTVEGVYLDTAEPGTAVREFEDFAAGAWRCAVAARGDVWARPYLQLRFETDRWLQLLYSVAWRLEHALVRAPRFTSPYGTSSVVARVEDVPALRAKGLWWELNPDPNARIFQPLVDGPTDAAERWWSLHPRLFASSGFVLDLLSEPVLAPEPARSRDSVSCRQPVVPTREVSLSHAAKYWFKCGRRTLKGRIERGVYAAKSMSSNRWVFDLDEVSEHMPQAKADADPTKTAKR